jgi:LEA14-like dessication related protein
MRTRMLPLVAPLFFVFAACSAVDDIKPKAPDVTPDKVSLTKISPTGLELLAEMAIKNPNDIDLEARSVTANVVLDGQYDLGTVEIPHQIDLPSDQETRLSVPLTLDWKDVAVVGTLIALKRSVPYDVDGKVNVGGKLLNVNVPFHVSDVITEEELRQALPGDSPPLQTR